MTEEKLKQIERMSSETQVTPEGHLSLDAQSKIEEVAFSSEAARETDSEMDDRKEICLLERASPELKSESNVEIKDEPAFASVYVPEPETTIHEDYQEVNIKSEIKEEPDILETSAETPVKHADFETEDNDEEEGECILPESPRMESPAMWNYQYVVENGCVKVVDNSNQERVSTNEAPGSDSINTYDTDETIPHKCKFCGKCFTLISDLRSHLVIHESKRLHTCQLCERSFTSSTSLKSHYLIHQGKKPHKCGVCGKNFTTIADLKRHNLVHEGKRPYKCNHCEKSFTRASHLKTHNLIHEGKKPHKCNICQKSFTQMSHLKAHKFLHEGVSQFKCEICEKSFAIASHLKVHNLIHEGKRPHKCQICGKSFIMASHLKAHNLIHEGKKPHMCAICEKRFTTSSELKRHHLTHEAIKPYKCNHCEKTYSTSANLKAHLLHESKKLQEHSVVSYVAVHYLDPCNYVTET